MDNTNRNEEMKSASSNSSSGMESRKMDSNYGSDLDNDDAEFEIDEVSFAEGGCPCSQNKSNTKNM